MWFSLTEELLRVGAACVLCALGAASAQAQYRTGAESLIDLSPQVYAIPDVPPLTESAGPGAMGVRFGNRALSRLVPDDYAVEYHDGLDGSVQADAYGLAPASFGLAVSSGVDSWSLGARNWRYISSSGYGVTLGNASSLAPAWSQSVRLAGVGIHRAPGLGREPGDGWAYAIAVGALDDSTDTLSSSDLTYGPAAYDASAKHAVNPNLTLASQAQGTSDLFALGLGGEYSMNDWGSWALGVSMARGPAEDGWRYQLGYKVDVFSDWRLSWVNEQRGEGYSDLSSYRENALACGCVRNQWQLSLPVGRWGKLSGTYEQLDRAVQESERTFGLMQQFWYSPHLRVRLEANRNIVMGTYGLGAKFSVPLD